jgi:predicted lipid-binding transport protein (Tim44 family)
MVTAKDVLGVLLLLYLLIWALALLEMLFLAAVLAISRGRSDAVRNLFRRSVAGSSGSAPTAGKASSPAAVAAALTRLHADDPKFSEAAFLDGTRLAVGAYAMAIAAEDDRLLRRITTPRYWQSGEGEAVAAAVAGWKRYAGERSGATNRGRVLFDLSWRQPEVRDVSLGDNGVDRITVRLASVIIGAVRMGWVRNDAVTRLDWEFVRANGEKTDPYAVMVPRACATCGAPYQSDFDHVCPHCQAPRPETNTGWRLDCSYLVLES